MMMMALNQINTKVPTNIKDYNGGEDGAWNFINGGTPVPTVEGETICLAESTKQPNVLLRKNDTLTQSLPAGRINQEFFLLNSCRQFFKVLQSKAGKRYIDYSSGVYFVGTDGLWHHWQDGVLDLKTHDHFTQNINGKSVTFYSIKKPPTSPTCIVTDGTTDSFGNYKCYIANNSTGTWCIQDINKPCNKKGEYITAKLYQNVAIKKSENQVENTTEGDNMAMKALCGAAGINNPSNPPSVAEKEKVYVALNKKLRDLAISAQNCVKKNDKTKLKKIMDELFFIKNSLSYFFYSKAEEENVHSLNRFKITKNNNKCNGKIGAEDFGKFDGVIFNGVNGYIPGFFEGDTYHEGMFQFYCPMIKKFIFFTESELNDLQFIKQGSVNIDKNSCFFNTANNLIKNNKVFHKYLLEVAKEIFDNTQQPKKDSTATSPHCVLKPQYSGKINKNTLTFAFCDMLYAQHKNQDQVITPYFLRQTLANGNPLFALGQASDTKDLLLHYETSFVAEDAYDLNVYDIITDKTNRANVTSTEIKNMFYYVSSPFSVISCSTKQSVFECCSCNGKTYEIQRDSSALSQKPVASDYNNIGSNGKGIKSLVREINETTTTELMQGENQMWCNKCKQMKNVLHQTRSSWFDPAIASLNIHFPCAGVTNGNQLLRLMPFYVKAGKHNYWEIDGFSIHGGANGGAGGHFMSFCKDSKTGKWYRFSDTECMEYTEDQVLKELNRDTSYQGLIYDFHYSRTNQEAYINNSKIIQTNKGSFEADLITSTANSLKNKNTFQEKIDMFDSQTWMFNRVGGAPALYKLSDLFSSLDDLYLATSRILDLPDVAPDLASQHDDYIKNPVVLEARLDSKFNYERCAVCFKGLFTKDNDLNKIGDIPFYDNQHIKNGSKELLTKPEIEPTIDVPKKEDITKPEIEPTIDVPKKDDITKSITELPTKEDNPFEMSKESDISKPIIESVDDPPVKDPVEDNNNNEDANDITEKKKSKTTTNYKPKKSTTETSTKELNNDNSATNKKDRNDKNINTNNNTTTDGNYLNKDDIDFKLNLNNITSPIKSTITNVDLPQSSNNQNFSRSRSGLKIPFKTSSINKTNNANDKKQPTGISEINKQPTNNPPHQQIQDKKSSYIAPAGMGIIGTGLTTVGGLTVAKVISLDKTIGIIFIGTGAVLIVGGGIIALITNSKNNKLANNNHLTNLSSTNNKDRGVQA